MEKIWINGSFVEPDDARISVYDRGFLYGDGVFETMRAYGGTVFALDKHLFRLKRSLAAVRIKVPHPGDRLKKIIYRLLKVNGLTDAYIRICVSRGVGRIGIDASERSQPTVVVIAKAYSPYPRWVYTKGLAVKVIRGVVNEASPLSRIKSSNYLISILARLEAKSGGFDDAVLTNTKGYVAEAATSNIFLVRAGRIITPSVVSGTLPGVTRKIILRLAKSAKIPVQEKEVSYRELAGAHEVFLTNSLGEVIPVTRVDGHPINGGRVGGITAMLASQYKALTHKRRRGSI